jgi:hypothetical protein
VRDIDHSGSGKLSDLPKVANLTSDRSAFSVGG